MNLVIIKIVVTLFYKFLNKEYDTHCYITSMAVFLAKGQDAEVYYLPFAPAHAYRLVACSRLGGN